MLTYYERKTTIPSYNKIWTSGAPVRLVCSLDARVGSHLLPEYTLAETPAWRLHVLWCFETCWALNARPRLMAGQSQPN